MNGETKLRKLTEEEAKNFEGELARALRGVGLVGRTCIDACGVKDAGVQLSMIEGFLTTAMAMASVGFASLAAYGEVPVEPGAGEQLQAIVDRSIDAALDGIFDGGEATPNA